MKTYLLEGYVIRIYTVKKVLADFAVCDVLYDAIAKLLSDVKFRQIKGNGRKFSHLKLSNCDTS